jgi:Uma2 family endonuclease
MKVMLGPFDIVLAEDTVLVPDLTVVSRTQIGPKNHPGPPLLAIEVLSPSTRRIDLLLRRDRLQSGGAPSYWLVDPVEVSLTVLELVADAYVEVAHAVGDEVCQVSKPYPMTVVPSSLLDQ